VGKLCHKNIDGGEYEASSVIPPAVCAPGGILHFSKDAAQQYSISHFQGYDCSIR
jgi:hypothetical protein